MFIVDIKCWMEKSFQENVDFMNLVIIFTCKNICFLYGINLHIDFLLDIK